MSSQRALKISFYSVNVIFAILGLATTGVSIFYYVKLAHFGNIFSTNFYLTYDNLNLLRVLPLFGFLSGLWTVIVAYCGCRGASKENKCLLGFYNVVMLISVIFYLVPVFLLFTVGVKNDILQSSLTLEFHKDSNFFDHIQRAYKCCGLKGANDYSNSRIYLPPSCCEMNYTTRSCVTFNASPGCSEVLASYLRRFDIFSVIASLSMAALEVISVAIASTLMCRKKV